MLNLFGPKAFSPKKAPPRKASSLTNLASLDVTQRAQEFGLEYGSASLKLNNADFKFEDGIWQSDSGFGGVPRKEMVKLKKENTRILEENNMLKLKLDILLDMLAETTAESHILEKEKNEALKMNVRQTKR